MAAPVPTVTLLEGKMSSLYEIVNGTEPVPTVTVLEGKMSSLYEIDNGTEPVPTVTVLEAEQGKTSSLSNIVVSTIQRWQRQSQQ